MEKCSQFWGTWPKTLSIFGCLSGSFSGLFCATLLPGRPATAALRKLAFRLLTPLLEKYKDYLGRDRGLTENSVLLRFVSDLW